MNSVPANTILLLQNCCYLTRSSVAGIVTGIRTGRQRTYSSDPGRTFFSPKRPIHLRCHPSSCSLGSEAFTPVMKRSELEVEPSRPSSAEVKNEWTSLPPYTFLACTGNSL
jgi:hypothetical protein